MCVILIQVLKRAFPGFGQRAIRKPMAAVSMFDLVQGQIQKVSRMMDQYKYLFLIFLQFTEDLPILYASSHSILP